MQSLNVIAAAIFGAALSQVLLFLAGGIRSSLEARWNADLLSAVRELCPEQPTLLTDGRLDVALSKVTTTGRITAGVAGAFGYGLCVWSYGLSISTILSIVAVSTLIVLSVIDFESCLLPDLLTIPLLWLGLLANLQSYFTTISDALIGACLGYLSMWILHVAYLRLTGRQGLGLGDAKLLAAAGAWIGWGALPEVALIAAASYLTLHATRFSRATDGIRLHPFGPHIALGFAYTLSAAPHLIPDLLAI